MRNRLTIQYLLQLTAHVTIIYLIKKAKIGPTG
jgi:hypothetical protein